MKNTKVNIGTISMMAGLVLCLIKISEAGLITWPWWVVAAPIYSPFLIFTLFLLSMALLVKVRGGTDKIAETVFDDDEIKVKKQDYEDFLRWQEEYYNEE